MSQERLFDGDDIGWYFVIHGGKGSGVRGRRKKLCLCIGCCGKVAKSVFCLSWNFRLAVAAMVGWKGMC